MTSVSGQRQFSAAIWVLLRRPAVWLVVVALMIQVGLLVSVLSQGYRSSDSELNIPSYEPDGARLWSVGDDMYVAYQNGDVNPSIQWLDLAYLDIKELDEGTIVELKNRSADSMGTTPEIVELSIPEFSAFLTKFPNVQWISFRKEQLYALPTSLFKQFPRLNSVVFEADELTTKDLERLSLLTNIEHLQIEAFECEHGLSPLSALPNLKSLHLKSKQPVASRQQAEAATAPLMSMDNLASVVSLPRLQELALDDDGQLFHHAFLTGLTADRLEQYSAFIQTMKQSSALQTVYVGYLQSSISSKLFQRLSGDLGHLSVRPARYNSAMAFRAMISNFATIFGLAILTMHLGTCTGGAQNGLLNGSGRAHVKVFLTAAAVFLLLSVAFQLLGTHANWLAVIAFQGTVFGVATQFGTMRPEPTGQTVNRWKTLNSLLSFSVFAFFLFVILGRLYRGVLLAWLFCGQYPLLCGLILVAVVITVKINLKHFLNLHRTMAESGVTPATTWAELQQASTAQAEMLHEQAQAQLQATNGTVEPKQDAWLNRLKSIVATLRQNPASTIANCRLWLAAGTAVSLTRMTVMLFFAWPICLLWPHYLGIITNGWSVITEQFSFLMMMTFFVGCFALLKHWHTRRAMFAMEILRPVTRDSWRKTTVQSLLIVTCVILLLSWGQVTLLQLLAGQGLPLKWVVLSLMSTFAASLLITGLNLWALVQARIVFAALLVLTGMAAFAPVVYTSISSTETILQNGATQFAMCRNVVIAETVLGIIVLRTAWNKWGCLELAHHS